MKKLLFAIAVFVFLSACVFCEKWEYKIASYSGTDASKLGASKNIANQLVRIFPTITIEKELNEWGNEGWELVSSYTTVESVFPNFGNDDYVTGINTNTRTYQICFVLKREID